MAEKPTLYLETTIPSYLVARPSRDVITLARQQLTHDWWDHFRHDYDIYVSRLVLDEVARGDAAYAGKRLDLIRPFPALATSQEVIDLAEKLKAILRMPARAAADSQHIAVCLHHGIDYLLTWNCAHLASAQTRRNLKAHALQQGWQTPTICTPEELAARET